MSPDQESDLSDELHCRVAKRMKHLPVFTKATTEGNSMSEVEEQPITQ